MPRRIPITALATLALALPAAPAALASPHHRPKHSHARSHHRATAHAVKMFGRKVG